MKHLKPFLPMLTAALALTAGALHSPPARADGTITVAPIQVTNLGPAAGKFLNVFFVRANSAILGVPGHQLEFVELMAPPIRLPIPSNGVVNIPQTSVTRRFDNGVTVTYSYLYLAVTDAQPNPLYLRNENTSNFVDPRIGSGPTPPDSSFQALHTAYISKIGLQSHLAPGGSYYVLDAMSDLSQ